LQKYFAVSLGAIAAVVTVAFLVLAQLHDGVAAPPTPVAIVTVDANGVSPQNVEIERGRQTELRLVNDTDEIRVLTTNAEAIAQLPLESTGAGPEIGNGIPQPVRVMAGARQTFSVLVRGNKAGTWTLTVEVPGKPETAQTASLTLR
jgi:hypothetical protein